MKSYRSEKIEILDSKINKKGAFANETICKGELVGIRSGHLVEIEEAMKLDETVGGSSLQLDEKMFLCAKTQDELFDILIYLNHSCNPNIGIMGQISFVAIKDIEKGEELYMDYATVVSHNYNLECHCGHRCCRKKITGNDWMIQDIQNQYKGFFSTHLQSKINDFLYKKSGEI